MKAFSVGIVSIVILLFIPNALLWAGSRRTISVSCVVKPRISAQMEQDKGLTDKENLTLKSSSTSNKDWLLQQKEHRTIGLPARYESAIIYTYCER